MIRLFVHAFPVLRKFGAMSEEVQGMVCNVKIEYLTGHFLDLVNTWITKFKHLSTILAYQVVMLLIPV